jgi:hypothetical protein
VTPRATPSSRSSAVGAAVEKPGHVAVGSSGSSAVARRPLRVVVRGPRVGFVMRPGLLVRPGTGAAVELTGVRLAASVQGGRWTGVPVRAFSTRCGYSHPPLADDRLARLDVGFVAHARAAGGGVVGEVEFIEGKASSERLFEELRAAASRALPRARLDVPFGLSLVGTLREDLVVAAFDVVASPALDAYFVAAVAEGAS